MDDVQLHCGLDRCELKCDPVSKFKQDVISVLKGQIQKITAAIHVDRSLFGKMECSEKSPKAVEINQSI